MAEREICDAYVEYAKVCFEEYGDKVTYWSTFNEPRYYVFSGYKIGNYPPGIDDTQKTIQASFYMMLANALTVKLFREMKMKGQIGIVHSYAPIFGVDDSLETKIAMRKADNYFNNWILDTAIKGEIPIDMLGMLNEKYDLSFMKEADFEAIKHNTVDFAGLNYYARALIKPYTGGESILRINNKGSEAKGSSKVVVKGWFEQVFDNPDSTYTEWDTEIYPQGLYHGIMRAYEKYKVPIFITENGVAFYEDVPNEKSVDDQGRIHFLNAHINAILNAIDDGAEVLGYFIWSTMDLYSWKNGHEKRYGLVGVDFENNFERKPKSSYYWYKKKFVSPMGLLSRGVNTMLNILIVCNAGMSSGILARKMEDSSKGEAVVKAVGVSEYQDKLENVDVILVGPQIRFQLNEIQENAELPAMTIDLAKYGIMDAEGILRDALQFYEGEKSS